MGAASAAGAMMDAHAAVFRAVTAPPVRVRAMMPMVRGMRAMMHGMTMMMCMSMRAMMSRVMMRAMQAAPVRRMMAMGVPRRVSARVVRCVMACDRMAAMMAVRRVPGDAVMGMLRCVAAMMRARRAMVRGAMQPGMSARRVSGRVIMGMLRHMMDVVMRAVWPMRPVRAMRLVWPFWVVRCWHLARLSALVSRVKVFTPGQNLEDATPSTLPTQGVASA